MTDLFQALMGNPVLLIGAVVFLVLIAVTIVKQLLKWAFILIVIAALFVYYQVQQGHDIDEAIQDVIEKVESVDVKEAVEAGGKVLEQARDVTDEAVEAVEDAKEIIESVVE